MHTYVRIKLLSRCLILSTIVSAAAHLAVNRAEHEFAFCNASEPLIIHCWAMRCAADVDVDADVDAERSMLVARCFGSVCFPLLHCARFGSVQFGSVRLCFSFQFYYFACVIKIVFGCVCAQHMFT